MKKKKFLIPFNRIAVLLILDALSVVVAAFAALWIRFEFNLNDIPGNYLDTALKLLPFNLLFTVLWLWIWKLYKSVWRYASANELINIAAATLFCGVTQIILCWIFHYSMPRSYYALYTFNIFVLICGIRFSYRILRMLRDMGTNIYQTDGRIRTMLIGAGEAANAIMKEIESSRYLNMKIVCVIDDDPKYHDKLLRGVPVIGGRKSIIHAAEEYEVEEIVVAIPSATKGQVKEILEICKETDCKLQILPGMYQILKGDISVSSLREVQIEDLLGREPIQINTNEVLEYVQGKCVAVTGGGGSIGSELCRQIAAHNPSQLIVIDIYENNAYEIQQELLMKYPNLKLTVLIASVREEERLRNIFEKYRPAIVYHAAAHKHVPLMEDSPHEAVKNNVFGTYKTAVAAAECGVQRFVLISTDKAVNPTNIMGATKRICEMIIQMMDKKYETEFVAVRFGNVLGSNGSVIPLFKKQIAAGGPVTVTHPDIIRYFMTIPEAVSLVLQAGAYAKGGEIFILDMGEPMKIYDLAVNLIRLSGYTPGEDINIIFTGLRPGEKLYEELLLSGEDTTQTTNQRIHIGKPIEMDEERFYEQLGKLEQTVENEEADITGLIQEMVPTFQRKEAQH